MGKFLHIKYINHCACMNKPMLGSIHRNIASQIHYVTMQIT